MWFAVIMSHQHVEMSFGQRLCISSENAFISTWQQIFKDAEFGLLGARVKFEILLSIESLLWSAEVSWGQHISALHSTYRFRLASLGTVINIPLEKAFCKGREMACLKTGDFGDFSAYVLSHGDVSLWSL